MDHVSTAFVNKQVELYLSSDTELDQSAVKNAIDATGAEFIDINKEENVSL